VIQKPRRSTRPGKKITSMKPLFHGCWELITRGAATFTPDTTSLAMAPLGSMMPMGVPGFPTGSFGEAPPLWNVGSVALSSELNRLPFSTSWPVA